MNKPLFKRDFLNKMLLFSNEHPDVIQALVGPRQVGKTTIARQMMHEMPVPSIYASADASLPPGPEWIETHWRQAQLKADDAGCPVFLVLDEIQKVTGWNETLKKLWDASTSGEHRIRLLILGSSSLLINAGLADSLAGRFFSWRCPHWSFTECSRAFGWSLEKWIFFGGYPGAAVFFSDIEQWKQYVSNSLVETVIARDVLQLQKVAKPALLRNLFILSSAYPAQILSYNKMLGQLQDAGNTTTLAHYLTLLESAFLVSGLPRFSRGEARRRGTSPKLILWNNALINALNPKSFADAIADPSWWGRLVENAVGAHLLNGLHSVSARVSYWREGTEEMDFVVESGLSILGIEVKSGRSNKTPGVARFRGRWPSAGVLVVGGEGMPLTDFFATPPEKLLTCSESHHERERS